jgi:hypothetical protein
VISADSFLKEATIPNERDKVYKAFENTAVFAD